eukprot:g30757.t1
MAVPGDLVAFAEELADAAGAVILKYWRKPLPVESKHEPGRPVAESPVTLADREAEAKMRQLIEQSPASLDAPPRSPMAIRRLPHSAGVALKARCLARAMRRFSSSDLFLPTDQFQQRHLGPLPSDVQEMCKVIGVKDLAELMELTIPASVRREQPMELPDGRLGESGSLALLKEMLSKNVIAKNYIGMGYHGSHVPGPILRNLLENPGWYTAYTPYQAEISQGRLESLAMAMIARAVNSKAKNQFFISDSVHPQSIDCIRTRAEYFGMELVIGDHTTTDFASMDKLCGALVQYPDTRGRFFSFDGIADALHKNGAYFVVAADPLSLVVAKPPSEFGADVVVGSMQRFGVPMWFGGPSAAYLATSKKQVRRMPGRLIGESLDRLGNPAYRLTLQTREQHIRLDKATSNVCTAQVLLANMAGMYAVYHRKDGLQRIAQRVHGLAQLFASEAAKAGVAVTSSEAFFDTVTFETPKAKAVLEEGELQKQKMNLRLLDDKTLAASFDETHLEADIAVLVAALKAAGAATGAGAGAVAVDGKLPTAFARHRAEGLNSVSSLAPCSWPEVANMHPFAPASHTAGYREMLESLEKYLISVTGFDACSLQPTSGASGEYAGLLVIKKYLEAQGQGPVGVTKDYCETKGVHEFGGQVYMDGANMNAQLGLTSPGIIGADVCHLNLHKTFSIPHGGGGPGLGPICVKKHLAKHLPGHCVVQPSSVGSEPAGAVSAAPWGQAGIACIPWMFCTMLGKQGVLDSARYSILNANYMKSRLEPHFDIAPTNKSFGCSQKA